jgi:hypothetical protein
MAGVIITQPVQRVAANIGLKKLFILLQSSSAVADQSIRGAFSALGQVACDAGGVHE